MFFQVPNSNAPSRKRSQHTESTVIQTITTNSILARPIKKERSNAIEGLSRKILLLCNVDKNSNKKQIQFIAMF